LETITVEASIPNNGLEYGSLPLAKVELDIVKIRGAVYRLSKNLKKFDTPFLVQDY
jgi:hypothetical protein